MVELLIERLEKKAKEYDGIAIVGAGNYGKELASIIEEKNLQLRILYVFDNNIESGLVAGVSICKPKSVDENVLYVITVSEKFRNEIRSQLLSIGVMEKNIFIYYSEYEYEYLSHLCKDDYKRTISDMYRMYLEKEINLESPRRYNEIINLEKISVYDQRRTDLADKYKAREWVKEKIGSNYLNELIAVYDDVNEIDFDSLPQSYVLKVNNGSNRNIIVKDKDGIDISKVKEQLNYWMTHNYMYGVLENHYGGIKPKILCEKYLEGVAETVYEYDIFCFHGEPQYIWCINGSHKEWCRASFYDLDWNMQDFSYGYPFDPIKAPRPEQLSEMLRLSRILSSEFKHVRVDWFAMPSGELYFGEMTFSTWGGFKKFIPDEMDFEFGRLITG